MTPAWSDKLPLTCFDERVMEHVFRYLNDILCDLSGSLLSRSEIKSEWQYGEHAISRTMIGESTSEARERNSGKVKANESKNNEWTKQHIWRYVNCNRINNSIAMIQLRKKVCIYVQNINIFISLCD